MPNPNALLLFQKQRKDLSPAFAFRHVKELYPIFWSKAGELTRALVLRNETVQDPAIRVEDWASRTTLDIIGIAGLGQDFNAIKDPTNELIRTYNKIFSPSRTGRILGILGLFLPRWLIANLP